MKRTLLSLLLLISMMSCINPSGANDVSSSDSNTTVTDPAKSTNQDNITESVPSANAESVIKTTPAQTKSSAVKKASLQKKVFSIATALLVGTPVCIVRRTKYEEWYEVNGFIGDSHSKCKKVVAGIICFPYALVCGTGEAPFDALTNGLIYPAFSKDQLSQGKLIQNN